MSKTRPPNKRMKNKKRQNLATLPPEKKQLNIVFQNDGFNKLANVIHDLYFSLKKSPEDAVTSPRLKNTERWYVHITRIIANRILFLSIFVFMCLTYL